MDKNMRDIIDSLAFIREHMFTKEEGAELRAELHTFRDEMRAELSSIRRDLNELTEKVDNITGYRKEIDHALERIAAIEKRLGINKRIAA